MIRLACILTTAVLVASQEATQPSIEQELDALIEETNALETVHLIYDAEGSSENGPVSGTFELIYSGPDTARLVVSSEEGGVDSWIGGTTMYWWTNLDGVEASCRKAAFPTPPPARIVLDELFPRQDKPLGPGPFFEVKLTDGDTSRPGFELHFGFMATGRSHLFGWLALLRSRSSELSIDEEYFVLEDDRIRCRVSRETGLLERIESLSGEDRKGLRLRQSHVDEPLDEALFDIPSEAIEAELDAEMTSQLAQIFGPGVVRHDAFLRVESQLRSERRTWNELTRRDWSSFLDALHRGMISDRYSEWIEGLEAHTDQWVEWVERQRTRDDSPDHLAELKERVSEARAKREESLELARVKYAESLPSIESEKYPPRQELFDEEQDVVVDLWEELVRTPVLSTFDEKLEEALRER